MKAVPAHQHDFSPGDVVFAKMKGYPFWPARVAEGKAPNNKIPIFFYGTHQTTSLFSKDVCLYWPNKEKHGRPSTRGGFDRAMWEVENDPGVGLRGQKKADLIRRVHEGHKKAARLKQKPKSSEASVPPSDVTTPTKNKTPTKMSTTPNRRSVPEIRTETPGRTEDTKGNTAAKISTHTTKPAPPKKPASANPPAAAKKSHSLVAKKKILKRARKVHAKGRRPQKMTLKIKLPFMVKQKAVRSSPTKPVGKTLKPKHSASTSQGSAPRSRDSHPKHTPRRARKPDTPINTPRSRSSPQKSRDLAEGSRNLTQEPKDTGRLKDRTPEPRESFKKPLDVTPDPKKSCRDPASEPSDLVKRNRTPESKESPKKPLDVTPDPKKSCRDSASEPSDLVKRNRTPESKESSKRSQDKTPEDGTSLKRLRGRTLDSRDSPKAPRVVTQRLREWVMISKPSPKPKSRKLISKQGDSVFSSRMSIKHEGSAPQHEDSPLTRRSRPSAQRCKESALDPASRSSTSTPAALTLRSRKSTLAENDSALQRRSSDSNQTDSSARSSRSEDSTGRLDDWTLRSQDSDISSRSLKDGKSHDPALEPTTKPSDSVSQEPSEPAPESNRKSEDSPVRSKVLRSREPTPKSKKVTLRSSESPVKQRSLRSSDSTLEPMELPSRSRSLFSGKLKRKDSTSEPTDSSLESCPPTFLTDLSSKSTPPQDVSHEPGDTVQTFSGSAQDLSDPRDSSGSSGAALKPSDPAPESCLEPTTLAPEPEDCSPETCPSDFATESISPPVEPDEPEDASCPGATRVTPAVPAPEPGGPASPEPKESCALEEELVDSAQGPSDLSEGLIQNQPGQTLEEPSSDIKENIPAVTEVPESVSLKKQQQEENMLTDRKRKRHEGDEPGRRRWRRRTEEQKETREEEEEEQSPKEEQDGGGDETTQESTGQRDTEEEKRKLRSSALAEKRMSVLKSLQGLVTSSRSRALRNGRSAEEEENVEERGRRAEQNKKSRSSDRSSRSKAEDDRALGQKALSVTDSLLYRLHGDIRISMTHEKPDVNKCLSALDELSSVSVSSHHIQNHSELIDTLRKMRWFRGSEAIMFKASMLYYRFKNIYLIGEPEETLSPQYIHSLQEETHTHCCSESAEERS